MTQEELPMESRREAHEKISPEKMARRQEVINALRSFQGYAGMTADEIAAHLGREPYRVRPRITELKKDGTIKPSGRRMGLHSSVKITVWSLS